METIGNVSIFVCGHPPIYLHTLFNTTTSQGSVHSHLYHGCLIFRVRGATEHIVWNATIQYSARRSPLSVHRLFYLLHSTMPSVTCLRLSDVSVICRVTYFQFPIQSAFLSYRSTGSTAAYWFTHVGHRTLPKFCVGTFLYVEPRGMILN